MSTIEQEYSLVKTFDELIKTNIKFLNGTYDHTCYHCVPVDEETMPMLDDLKVVNKLGFFTTDSQPETGFERFTEINGCGYYTLYEQRSYLEGFVSNYKNLKKYLQSIPDIYYLIEYPDDTYNTNIPFEKDRFQMKRSMNYFTINSEKKIISDWENGYSCIPNHEMKSYTYDVFDDNVKKVLDECVFLIVVTKDFDSKVNLRKLMIDYFVTN